MIIIFLVFVCSGFTFSNQENKREALYNCNYGNVLLKDTLKNKIDIVAEKFREERKNNRKNLKEASPYYNPIKIIYSLFRW